MSVRWAVPSSSKPRGRSCLWVRGCVELVVLFAAFAWISGCGFFPRSKPNVLFLLIDSLRSDHLGFSGYHRPTSACLDSLASAGAAFPWCIAQAPYTMTSVPSLLTGRYPSGAFRWTTMKMPDDTKPAKAVVLGDGIASIPSLLRPYGYMAAAFVANPIVAKNLLGLAEAFDHFDGSLDHCWSKICAEQLNRLVLAWLGTGANEPWFCFVHYMDVHDPYDPPLKYASRFIPTNADFPVISRPWIKMRQRQGGLTRTELAHVVGMYDAEIAYLDEQICTLLNELKELGLSDNLLVVIASDHGDEFMDHGAMGHGHTLYDELIRCPAVFSWNGHIPRGVVVDEYVENIDIAASILDLLKVDVPPGLHGSSLVPLFTRTAPPRPAFSEMKGVAIRRGTWKLWLRPGGIKSLFDLSADPFERKNLARQDPQVLSELEAELRDWQENLVKPPFPSPLPQEAALDSVTVEMLRSLGYIE